MLSPEDTFLYYVCIDYPPFDLSLSEAAQVRMYSVLGPRDPQELRAALAGTRK